VKNAWRSFISMLKRQGTLVKNLISDIDKCSFKL